MKTFETIALISGILWLLIAGYAMCGIIWDKDLFNPSTDFACKLALTLAFPVYVFVVIASKRYRQ